MQFVTRLVYLPLFLLVGNGLAIFLVQNGYPKAWLLGLAAAFVAIAFLFERVAPYDATFNKPRGDASRDFWHALVNESLSVGGVMSIPLLAQLNPISPTWPTEAPLWLQLLLAVVIADIGITLAHFASHRLGSLWRLHAVHHSVKRMYGFNGLMKHPLHQSIETLAGTTPLLLMGAPVEVMILLVVAVVLQLLLQHSNVAYFTGPLKFLLAINVVHRFHHLNNAEEGDVNFGLFTSLTDRLLGTVWAGSSGATIWSLLAFALLFLLAIGLFNVPFRGSGGALLVGAVFYTSSHPHLRRLELAIRVEEARGKLSRGEAVVGDAQSGQKHCRGRDPSPSLCSHPFLARRLLGWIYPLWVYVKLWHRIRWLYDFGGGNASRIWRTERSTIAWY